jgi:hypothetical protein
VAEDGKPTFRIARGASMWIGPVGSGIGDPGWRHVGHTSEDAFYTVDDDEPIDMEALRRGLAGGRTISTTFTMTRRQMRGLMRIVAPKIRNRRRNPLHAVRDRLRRHHRERSRER